MPLLLLVAGLAAATDTSSGGRSECLATTSSRGEWSSQLSCNAGEVISKVDFAYFGQPFGACNIPYNSPRINPSCDSAVATRHVDTLCTGANGDCIVSTSPALLGVPGPTCNPNDGTHLVVQYRCSTGHASATSTSHASITSTGTDGHLGYRVGNRARAPARQNTPTFTVATTAHITATADAGSHASITSKDGNAYGDPLGLFRFSRSEEELIDGSGSGSESASGSLDGDAPTDAPTAAPTETTDGPTTAAPTTVQLTTVAGSTEPTTVADTTAEPTTAAPTTAKTTTAKLTTVAESTVESKGGADGSTKAPNATQAPTTTTTLATGKTAMVTATLDAKVTVEMASLDDANDPGVLEKIGQGFLNKAGIDKSLVANLTTTAAATRRSRRAVSITFSTTVTFKPQEKGSALLKQVSAVVEKVKKTDPKDLVFEIEIVDSTGKTVKLSAKVAKVSSTETTKVVDKVNQPDAGASSTGVAAVLMSAMAAVAMLF